MAPGFTASSTTVGQCSKPPSAPGQHAGLGPSGGDSAARFLHVTPSQGPCTRTPSAPSGSARLWALGRGLQRPVGTALPQVCREMPPLACYQWGSGGTEQSGGCRGSPGSDPSVQVGVDSTFLLCTRGCGPVAVVTPQGPCSDGLRGPPRQQRPSKRPSRRQPVSWWGLRLPGASPLCPVYSKREARGCGKFCAGPEN